MVKTAKTSKATKTAKTEENEFFRVNDRVQWFRTDGEPRVIGVITKLFKDKCWLQPAGADGVGEVITGVLLDQLELYSDAPGPIETALAELGGEQPEGDRNSLLDDNEEKLDLDQSASVGTLINAEEAAAESESTEPETFWLPIAAIAEHPTFQPRGKSWQTEKGISHDVVIHYQELLEYSEPPALEVWHGRIGDEEGWWLLSGHHRIRALKNGNRDKAQCFQKAETYEEAIYRSTTSNTAGGDKTRQIYLMQRDELGEACKNFLWICDRLSEKAVNEFLDQAKAAALAAGITRTWDKLNDAAIGRVFGIPRSTVGLYRKHVELEKECADFPKGTRVLLVNYTEIHLLKERKYRLGVVENFHAGQGVRVAFDYSRGPNGYFLPKDLKKVDDPIYEKPTKLSPGDRVWNKDEGDGVVISITPEPAVSWLKRVSEEYPLICWEDGSFSANGLYNTDFEGNGEPPSIEEQLLKIKGYLANNSEDEAGYLWDYMLELQNHLQSLLPDEEADAEEETPTSIAQEEKSQRKELLGRSQPAGGGKMNGSELPDVSGTNGKHPEDPATVAVGPLERPAEATGLEQARAESRKSAALNRYNDLLFDLEVIPDDELKELIKVAKSELTRRHRPSQEGDPEKQELKAS